MSVTLQSADLYCLLLRNKPLRDDVSESERDTTPICNIEGYRESKTMVPDSKVHEANMGPIWGRQDPIGPLVAPWTLLSGVRDNKFPE